MNNDWMKNWNLYHEEPLKQEKPASTTLDIATIFGVELTTNQLTTEELAILVRTLDVEGYPYRNLPFYEKIEPLFVGGEATLHKDVKEAIIILAGMRMQKEKTNE